MAKMRQISLVAMAARGPSRRHNTDPRVRFMRTAHDEGTAHDDLPSTVVATRMGLCADAKPL